MGSTKFPILWRELAALLATGCDVEPIEHAPAAVASSWGRSGQRSCPAWLCMWELKVSGPQVSTGAESARTETLAKSMGAGFGSRRVLRSLGLVTSAS